MMQLHKYSVTATDKPKCKKMLYYLLCFIYVGDKQMTGH